MLIIFGIFSNYHYNYDDRSCYIGSYLFLTVCLCLQCMGGSQSGQRGYRVIDGHRLTGSMEGPVNFEWCFVKGLPFDSPTLCNLLQNGWRTWPFLSEICRVRALVFLNMGEQPQPISYSGHVHEQVAISPSSTWFLSKTAELLFQRALKSCWFVRLMQSGQQCTVFQLCLLLSLSGRLPFDSLPLGSAGSSGGVAREPMP